MDSEDLSSDASCLVGIGEFSELHNVSNEVAVAITEQSNLTDITTEDSQNSSNVVHLKEEVEGLSMAPDAVSEMTIPLDKENGGGDGTGVEGVYQIDPNSVGEGYIILSQDGTSNLGMVSNDDEDESGEPAAKRLHFQGENGQSYVLTVSDNSVAMGSMEAENESKHFLVHMPGGSKTGAQGANKKGVQSNDVNQAWFTTRDDKQALQNTGVSWKQGQWTKEEVDILQNNITTYCKEHNISDPTEVIFEMSKDERKDFYRTVAKGLQRPLFSVYRRVTRMYDQKNYVGKYTPEEIYKLKELRSMYGNDWASIGLALGRSASSVKDKCRLMKDTCNSGKWLPMEERKLCSAVYELTGAKQGENITCGLSWANVAEKVGTRSEKQCRTKWLNYLNWKQKGGAEWTREDDIQLILTIANLNVSDDTEIDWNELSKNWPSVRSPQWLRGKWWSLKRFVPDYKILPFPELLDFLKTTHLQAVRIKNQVRMSSDGAGRIINMPVTEGIINVPVAIQTTNIDKGDIDTDGSARLQAYETSVGTFLITQPNNNPAITIQGSTCNLSTDHIIVHTLPATSLHSIEGMTVQMNPPNVILSTGNSTDSGEVSLDSTEISPEIKLTDDIAVNDQGLAALANGNEAESDVSQSGLVAETQIISTEFDNQVVF
ncbi:hypothetical protein FSP39_002865 [Pinctada imbricata]|uniref:Cyclin-D-binding Myb-like transcription factor 1 n=1 Tax=Pinctada imbricata TaxID=66713 RepID=A0AA88YA62_PINIB|nr:hypothetical protein FSP39_002865 [Pinctada imbricata]